MRGSLICLMALAAAEAGCRRAPPESSPPESTAVEGVYGLAPQAVGGTPSVITLRPSMPATASGAAGELASGDRPRMDQLGLVFTPAELIVRVGEVVVFANSETLAHNVHVRYTDTDSTVLNVDTDPAARVEHVFEREGGYDVTCEEHPGMRAFIYATSAPYASFAEATGEFVVPGVPAGAYTLSVWSVDPSLRSEQPIEVSGSSTEVQLNHRTG